MNNTKIEIIENLEPYLDKTLYKGIIVKYCPITWDQFVELSESTIRNKELMKFVDEEDIYWHYHLGAFLIYVTEKHWSYKPNEEFENCIDIINCYWKVIWQISKKPMFLFSEKEEKNILEIIYNLQKI